MKNVELLPITSEARKRLTEFARQYRQFARIVVEVVSYHDTKLVVRVEQKQVNGKQLTRKELVDRVRELFSGEIPDGWTLNIAPVDFDRKDIEAITPEWIAGEMEALGLKAKHICTHTGLDKSTLSTLLSGNRPLTKWQKVAFYYFFKYQRVSPF